MKAYSYWEINVNCYFLYNLAGSIYGRLDARILSGPYELRNQERNLYQVLCCNYIFFIYFIIIIMAI
jgi:hypothetical protein